MDNRILKLLGEIDNQLSHAANVTTHETTQAGLVSLQIESRDYFDGLSELKEQIYSKWGLQKVLQRQNTSSSDDNHTQDIWENKDLEHWITTDRSSIIFLESALPFNLRLDLFLLELIDHLSEHHPVTYILDLPQIPEFGALGAPTPQAVLQQLMTHVLQFVSPQTSLQTIVEMLICFEQVQSLQDWFELLLQCCKTIPRITILLDIRILRSHSENVHSWPSIFAKSIAQSTSSSQSCLKIMFVTSSFQSLHCQEKAPVVSVGRPTGIAYWASPFPTLSVLRPTKPYPKPPSISKRSRTEPLSISTRSVENDAAKPLLGKAADNNEFSVLKDGLTEPAPISESGHIATKRPVPPETSDDIKIAILCALTLEANAVEALFDCYWDEVDESKMKTPGDKNSYSFGMLGGHQVVLAYMPSMGKASGAMVASYCSSSFRKVVMTLVVGICGGVPFYTQDGTQEVILGDVIISEEIVVYDFGRQYPEGFARKKGSLDIPGRLPFQVRSFLKKLKGTRHMDRLRERTCNHLGSLMDHHSNLVSYPGAERDRLFEGTYRHKHHGATPCVVCPGYRDQGVVCDGARDVPCEELGCDESRTVWRERLRRPVGSPMLSQSAPFSPVIHFGSMASGDQVMKSGEDRDRMASSEDIIAFEMEAAGVWDVVSCCLVIKGVCDYADSHKNKEWQKYAAATAAACTKALLQEWPIVD
ncbi:putative pfs domain-containing protein [Colletotrichum sublineola]|uniref:Putative pfs domain-containing protein n=1 Tax=Colletotrichum sublineola TaxID=1173701 RepID=A0A066WV69_COLSU|nr:putative pfs domain-containing protein [Colletotrichum sublineola]